MLSFLPAAASAQWEVEADPTAYAVSGYSAHVAHPIFDGKSRRNNRGRDFCGLGEVVVGFTRVNKGSVPAVTAFLLIDAKPVEVGKELRAVFPL
jgi:hypothetical protein